VKWRSGSGIAAGSIVDAGSAAAAAGAGAGDAGLCAASGAAAQMAAISPMPVRGTNELRMSTFPREENRSSEALDNPAWLRMKVERF